MFGRWPVVRSTLLLAGVLTASLLIVAVFIAVGVSSADAPTWDGFAASGLAVGGIGGAVAFAVASLMGIDAPGSFVEETVDRRAVSRTITGALVLGGVYALAAWAMGLAVGPTSPGKPPQPTRTCP
ncbi:hypothetical protein [Verrucosispora sioxanthis]|uniref:Uncharacterized protein n=1 Tax=Verrucosispora sioxanthis TaxID=2499994 RepID=A0A6M1LBJ7_9ACTN|nr:hypothetical protein [Verrucosispora sioxanthis]NEE66530.1 hypothetical protein [Verrucosispora sioxanthis]NGM15640.1 hypothetical protein [Verrucosispora sioxanthis]